MHYAYLLLYLHGKDTRTLTKLEEYVAEQVAHCKVDWLPNGHSLRTRKIQEDGQKKDVTLRDFTVVTGQISAPPTSSALCEKLVHRDSQRSPCNVHAADRIAAMETKNKYLEETLSAITERLSVILMVVTGEDARTGVRVATQLKHARKTIETQEAEMENLRAQCKKLENKLQKSKDKQKRS